MTEPTPSAPEDPKRAKKRAMRQVYEDRKKAGLPARPRGRPRIEYDTGYAQLCYKLALLGATQEEMADAIGISSTLFKAWLKSHSDFSAAINDGRIKADADMAHSLYQRGRGYSHTATKIFMVDETVEERDPSTGNVTSVITTKKERYVPYTEHYPPDTAAAYIWLKNRQPDRWRERTEHAVSVDGEVVFKLEVAKPADELPPPSHDGPTLELSATPVDEAEGS